MTRRAVRRRYAILGTLHEHGPQFALDLCQLLHRAPGTIYPDLTDLEARALITGDWERVPDDRPRRRRYRITTSGERADSNRLLRQLLGEREPESPAIERPKAPRRFGRPETAAP